MNNTLPGQKNTLIFHWTVCFGYRAHLFRQPYAMSEHLSPSRVTIIFGRDFVLMAVESNHPFGFSQQIPKMARQCMCCVILSRLTWSPLTKTSSVRNSDSILSTDAPCRERTHNPSLSLHFLFMSRSPPQNMDFCTM